jgi:deoxyribonuclease V
LMKPILTHPWDVPPAEAMAIQRDLQVRVVSQFTLDEIHTVAGVDVSVQRGKSGQDEMARAAVVVLSYPELEPLEQEVAEVPISFPYVPGFLAFREGPAVLAALAKLSVEPDLLIFDGQGLAHPRRFGIASHIGVLLDCPSIGCAKSLLCGSYNEPPTGAGTYTLLRDGGEVIGAVVRTRAGAQPVFVSIGHKIELETAVRYVLSCCRGYRLPEPTRLAHQVAGGVRIVPEAHQPSLFNL